MTTPQQDKPEDRLPTIIEERRDVFRVSMLLSAPEYRDKQIEDAYTELETYTRLLERQAKVMREALTTISESREYVNDMPKDKEFQPTMDSETATGALTECDRLEEGK